VRDEDSLRYAVLELEPGPEPGTVRLRGVETGLYLAMDNRGWLHASEQVEDLSTVFIERAAGRGESSTFLSASQAHKGWKVGIRRSGRTKNGKRTVFPALQRATEFLHRQPFPSPTIMADHLPDFIKESQPPIAFIDDEQESQAQGL